VLPEHFVRYTRFASLLPLVDARVGGALCRWAVYLPLFSRRCFEKDGAPGDEAHEKWYGVPRQEEP